MGRIKIVFNTYVRGHLNHQCKELSVTMGPTLKSQQKKLLFLTGNASALYDLQKKIDFDQSFLYTDT